MVDTSSCYPRVHPPRDNREDLDPTIATGEEEDVCAWAVYRTICRIPKPTKKSTGAEAHLPTPPSKQPASSIPPSKGEAWQSHRQCEGSPPLLDDGRPSSLDDLSVEEDNEVEGDDSDCILSNFEGTPRRNSIDHEKRCRRPQPQSLDSTIWEDDYQRSQAGVATAQRVNDEGGEVVGVSDSIPRRRGGAVSDTEKAPVLENIRNGPIDRLNAPCPGSTSQPSNIHVGEVGHTIFLQDSSSSSDSWYRPRPRPVRRRGGGAWKLRLGPWFTPFWTRVLSTTLYR
jgi:hypothetical protein